MTKRTTPPNSEPSSRGFAGLRGKVLLLIPAFRCEKTIRETLESILSQGPALKILRQVILSDDAGGDRTNEIGAALWKHTVPLTIRKCETNLGEYRMCNQVIAELPAEVEWVLIMHGDNLARPGWLEAILSELIHAHPDLATLSTSWGNLLEDGTIAEGVPESDPNYREFLGTRETVRDTLYKGCWWHISSCAIRVSAFRQVGGLPTNGMRHKGDWFLVAKFFQWNLRVGYIPKPLLLYRMNPVGSSSLSYRATGDITEALWVISQFTSLLTVKEVAHLHWELLHNLGARALKAGVTLRLGHFFDLGFRARDVLFGCLLNTLRVARRRPWLGGILDFMLGLLDWARDWTHFGPGPRPPLNGQQARTEMVRQIGRVFPVKAVIETGTYRASTTEFLATELSAPVYTCELSRRFLTYSRLRLAKRPTVKIWGGDSVRFLEKLRDERTVPTANVFFYLDAHWEKSLPLREEIRLIRQTYRDFVVLIDDFRVPDDAGYGYDDYGARQRLDLEEFRAEFAGLHVFFPSTPSAQETGLRRGSIVLTDSPAVARRLESLSRLRSWPSATASLVG